MTYFDELELDTLPEYNYARELAKAAANWRNYVKPKEEIEIIDFETGKIIKIF